MTHPPATNAEIDCAKKGPTEMKLQWNPPSNYPVDRPFIIGVWEGEWRNPRQKLVAYTATMSREGYPVWANRFSYRTEEGGAFQVAGWIEMPEPPIQSERR